MYFDCSINDKAYLTGIVLKYLFGARIVGLLFETFVQQPKEATEPSTYTTWITTDLDDVLRETDAERNVSDECHVTAVNTKYDRCGKLYKEPDNKNGLEQGLKETRPLKRVYECTNRPISFIFQQEVATAYDENQQSNDGAVNMEYKKQNQTNGNGEATQQVKWHDKANKERTHPIFQSFFHRKKETR